MNTAYLIINIKNPKKMEMKNLFLDKNNCVKQLNILNTKIFQDNLKYLNEKLSRSNKQFKRDKLKNIIKLYLEVYEKAKIAVNQNLPLYITPSFIKYLDVLKYSEFYFTEVNIQKVNQTDQQ